MVPPVARLGSTLQSAFHARDTISSASATTPAATGTGTTDSSNVGGIIAGGVIVGLLLLLGAAAYIYYYERRMRQRRQSIDLAGELARGKTGTLVEKESGTAPTVVSVTLPTVMTSESGSGGSGELLPSTVPTVVSPPAPPPGLAAGQPASGYAASGLPTRPSLARVISQRPLPDSRPWPGPASILRRPREDAAQRLLTRAQSTIRFQEPAPRHLVLVGTPEPSTPASEASLGAPLAMMASSRSPQLVPARPDSSTLSNEPVLILDTTVATGSAQPTWPGPPAYSPTPPYPSNSLTEVPREPLMRRPTLPANPKARFANIVAVPTSYAALSTSSEPIARPPPNLGAKAIISAPTVSLDTAAPGLDFEDAINPYESTAMGSGSASPPLPSIQANDAHGPPHQPERAQTLSWEVNPFSSPGGSVMGTFGQDPPSATSSVVLDSRSPSSIGDSRSPSAWDTHSPPSMPSAVLDSRSPSSAGTRPPSITGARSPPPSSFAIPGAATLSPLPAQLTGLPDIPSPSLSPMPSLRRANTSASPGGARVGLPRNPRPTRSPSSRVLSPPASVRSSTAVGLSRSSSARELYREQRVSGDGTTMLWRHPTAALPGRAF